MTTCVKQTNLAFNNFHRTGSEPFDGVQLVTAMLTLPTLICKQAYTNLNPL
jgi:hypothetical protein